MNGPAIFISRVGMVSISHKTDELLDKLSRGRDLERDKFLRQVLLEIWDEHEEINALRLEEKLVEMDKE